METVKLVITWEEYKTLLAGLQAINNMVDNEKLDSLYIKLYMQMNVTSKGE